MQHYEIRLLCSDRFRGTSIADDLFTSLIQDGGTRLLVDEGCGYVILYVIRHISMDGFLTLHFIVQLSYALIKISSFALIALKCIGREREPQGQEETETKMKNSSIQHSYHTHSILQVHTQYQQETPRELTCQLYLSYASSSLLL